MTLKNYGAIGGAGSPLPAAGCNERVLVHRDGAHGVTRPTMTGPIKAAPRKVLVAVRHRRRNSSHAPVRRRNTTVFQGIFALPAVIGLLLIFKRKHPNQGRRQNGCINHICRAQNAFGVELQGSPRPFGGFCVRFSFAPKFCQSASGGTVTSACFADARAWSYVPMPVCANASGNRISTPAPPTPADSQVATLRKSQPRSVLSSLNAGGELLGDPGQPFIVGADARGERARGGL